MPQPESYDLRQKVIQAIKLDGLKIIEASQLFNRASQHDRPSG
jgi:transposase